MRVRFREKNPVIIAGVGLLILAVLLFGSFQLAALPIFGGTTYKALFTDSGGLVAGDKVKVAGTQVGKVKSVDLVGPDVLVTFTVKGVPLGRLSSAEIKTQTLLGERNLGVVSNGPGAMSAGDTIPLSRTRPPYDLTQDLDELSERTSQLDVNRVGEALDAFSQSFSTTPKDVAPALEGITRLSRTISSRNEALQTLLHHAEQVTGVLREHTGEVTTLLIDGNSLLAELQERHQAIHDLLVNTTRAADEVSGLAHDQQGRLKPALDQLEHTLAILRQNDGNIVSSIQRVSSFIVGLGEGLASGPWFSAAADLAGTGGALLPTRDFVPSLAVPQPPPAKPGSIPTVPSVPGLLGVGGNG
jgi:phospholipid/cholesterol/gamma-HCH transport system substrate-binding protein